MFAPFIKYQKAIGLIVVIILLLMTIGWTSGEREQDTVIENAVISVTSPIQTLFSSIGGRVQAAYNFIAELQHLSAENRRLRQKVEEYEQAALVAEELKQENQRLREMLEFQEREAFALEPAQVIGRSPDTWNQTIVINRGKNQGVKQNMPVINTEGLVGHITSVSSSTSKVLLIINPDSAVSGMVQESREMGMVEGEGIESSKLQMINIPKDAEISLGQNIISSGVGPVFPKGLLVGHVEEIKEEMSGFTNRAIIEPAVKFSTLEEVFVVKSGDTGLEIENGEIVDEPASSEEN